MAAQPPDDRFACLARAPHSRRAIIRHRLPRARALFRTYLSLDQFAQDMPDQVMRFLNALRVVAFDDQRQIAKRFHAAAVAAEQANHSDSLRPRLLASSNNVRR